MKQLNILYLKKIIILLAYSHCTSALPLFIYLNDNKNLHLFLEDRF